MSVLFFTGLMQVCSQPDEYSTKSIKAIGLYEEAERCFNLKDYQCVLERIQNAIDIDKNFIEAYLLLIDMYDETGDKEKEIKYCYISLSIDSKKYPLVYYYLALALYQTAKYSDALTNANTFLSLNKFTANQKKYLQHVMINCEFALKAIQHPVTFSPVNLGDSINTKYDEYWPSISADEQTLVFTRLIPRNENYEISNINRQEDFFESVNVNGVWQGAKPLGPPINTPGNEGAQSLSADGQKMYFTACDRPDGMGKCDIYFSYKKGDTWSNPVNLGPPVNTEYSEKQPSISSDGKTLYYVSNNPKGKGKYDIWMSTLSSDGTWTEPVNLGDSVNTPYDEQSPFIHPDNKTLYFASDGWPGMGGLDVFYTRRKSDNTWSTPVNLGYPINTNSDEMGLVLNAKGNHAYYSSGRTAEKGKDIYEFELYEEARPQPVSYMKGKVYDSETKAPLRAKFELIDLQTSKTISEEYSSKYNGEFLVCIPTERDYALNVSKKGYLFFSENFTLSGIHEETKPFLKDVPLQQLKAGNKIILKNIFFETNSYELKAESTAELDKVVQFLNDNPSLKVEISGHTDNTGTNAFNQILSENRAKAVAEYLIKKGIPQIRLTSKGYGRTVPVADNNTDEGRAQNRRTEFKIISY
jgi:outer membrane protein OmpA-like peptidoglycan-associated protein